MSDDIKLGYDDEKPEPVAVTQSYDANNLEQVNEARKKAGRKRKNLNEYLKQVMEHRQGREFIYGILSVCGVHSTPFVQGDPYATAFKCGEQNVGHRILADVVASSPDEYVVMCKENNV